MRVLYLTHIGELSGGEIALVRLVSALRNTNVVPIVALGADGPLRSELTAAGARVLVVPLTPALRDTRKDAAMGGLTTIRRALQVLSYSWTIRKLILDEGIDLVHSNSLKAGFYGGIAARMARRPMVWHLRDRLAPDYLPRSAILMARSAIAILSTRAVCNSKSTLETLTLGGFGFLRRRATAVSSPLSDVFDGGGAPPRFVAEADAQNPLEYVMVGRIAPWKGQDLVVQAFEQADIAPARLTIVGSAMFGEQDFANRLTSQVEESVACERISLTGFQQDVARKLRDYDILVHASRSPEPFGQVIIEGLAAGLVVIAADAGGPSEILTHDVDGLLFEPGNIDALRIALERTASGRLRRSEMIRQGQLRALDYAPGRIARQMVEIYEDALG